MRRIGNDHGLFSRLDTRHIALMIDEESDTLLISFDRADRLWSQGAEEMPLGFPAVPAHGISLLSLMSIGRTWFASSEVEAFLAGLESEGFFATYARFIIIAAGPDCGYAAARAVSKIPGAQVCLARPASSMDAALPPIQSRFGAQIEAPMPLRPDALGRAARAIILYDPSDPVDAAQVTAFRNSKTVRIAIPLAGDALVRAFRNVKTLVTLTGHIMHDTFTEPTAYGVLRDALKSDQAYRAQLARPR